jgi:hypothetical protein
MRCVVGMALLGAAMAVASCGGPRVVPGQVSASYLPTEFYAVAGSRDMRTTVEGNPFAGVPDEAFDEAATAAMYGAHFGPPTRFTTMPGPSATPGYRVRIVFNPSPAINGGVMCAGGAATTNAAARPMVVKMAYCYRSGTMNDVTGYLDAATGPNDPGFIQLMRTMTDRLFPPNMFLFY